MEIHETWRLGLDLGIGSCGWAIVEESGPASGRIVALGVRTFDVPETDKERTPTNQLRRQHRGLRKVLRRRRQRMNQIRRLFRTHLLIADERKRALKISGLDPWVLRAEALERRLSGPELAVALGHIAKHRGFKSNSKRERGANAPKEISTGQWETMKPLGEVMTDAEIAAAANYIRSSWGNAGSAVQAADVAKQR